MWKKLHRWWSGLRIQYKLALILLLAIGMVSFFSMGAIRVVSHFYEQLLYTQAAGTLQLASINIEKELQRIEQISFTILQNRDIQQSLDRIRTIRSEPILGQEKKRLVDLLWITTFEKNVLSVNIIDVFGNQYAGGLSFSSSHIPEIVQKAAQKQGSMEIHILKEEPGVLVCARQIRKIEQLSLEPLGTLLIRVNLKKMVQEALAGVLDRMSLVILSDSTPFYASDPILAAMAQRFVASRHTYGSLDNPEGRRYFVTVGTSTQNSWTYVTFIEYERIFKRLELVNSLSILILILLVFFAYFILVRIGRSISLPLELLSAYATHVEKGDFTIPFIQEDVFLRHNDEIGQIERDFIFLLNKINDLIKENYAHELLAKDAQLKALEAQINPHFLYNTLDTVHWLAKLRNEQEIAAIVEALAYILRKSLSSKEPTISLREELELLKAYVTIQKIRFGKKLEVSYFVAPELESCTIPKLTLQPIVENSIIHGIEATGNPCFIRVESEDQGDDFVLHISDTGPGFQEEKEKKRGSGIGLANIHQRIQLLCGESYGLSIQSVSKSGTMVSIHLPKRRAEPCTQS
ncbi:MAG: sensor histidine kinase [Treponemataceae bacterium]|nr:sensor histidine kinase [Treponemataceae bacterium]